MGRKARLAFSSLEEVPPPQASPDAAEPPDAGGQAGLIAQAYGFDPVEGRLCRIVDGKFVLRYQGIVNLARRTGKIAHVECRVVHEKDSFGLDYGRHVMTHAPFVDPGDVGTLTSAYAIVRSSDMAETFEHARAQDLVKGIKETDPRAVAAGTLEDFLKREVLIRAFEAVAMDLPLLSAALEAERQSLAGLPITSLPPK